jgi:hypothetical protein
MDEMYVVVKQDQSEVQDDENRTYLPPFLGSFTLSDLCHILLIIISNISHVRNQQILGFKKMDRVICTSAPKLSRHLILPALYPLFILCALPCSFDCPTASLLKSTLTDNMRFPKRFQDLWPNCCVTLS